MPCLHGSRRTYMKLSQLLTALLFGDNVHDAGEGTLRCSNHVESPQIRRSSSMSIFGRWQKWTFSSNAPISKFRRLRQIVRSPLEKNGKPWLLPLNDITLPLPNRSQLEFPLFSNTPFMAAFFSAVFITKLSSHLAVKFFQVS